MLVVCVCFLTRHRGLETIGETAIAIETENVTDHEGARDHPHTEVDAETMK